MPANSESFPWPSYYGHYKFFEARIRTHHKVVKLKSLEEGLYEITRSPDETLRIFVCECYSFGVAEYVETVDRFGSVDAIIINSAWCSYTYDAKHQCFSEKVGLYKIVDFMRALNKSDFWKYLSEAETEVFKDRNWL